MSKNLEVEICCGSYYDTLQAWKGGAKRVELNSALHLGGLTVSWNTSSGKEKYRFEGYLYGSSKRSRFLL